MIPVSFRIIDTCISHLVGIKSVDMNRFRTGIYTLEETQETGVGPVSTNNTVRPEGKISVAKSRAGKLTELLSKKTT